MSESTLELTAENFLELASYQRLAILFKLREKNSRITQMAEELGATKQEVHRNFDRLVKAALIAKDLDGNFTITTYGKTLLTQIPSQIFLTGHKEYFENHDFQGIPQKFIQRIGQLAECQTVKGLTRVLESWNEIFKNANEYIYGMVYEEPLETIEPIVERAKADVNIKSIFSEGAVVPKKRKELLKKLGFEKLVEKNIVQRKMQKDLKTVVILNEKKACVMFPTKDGQPDLSQMFFSDDGQFHEWCLDYFRYCWYGSNVFQERKLKI